MTPGSSFPALPGTPSLESVENMLIEADDSVIPTTDRRQDINITSNQNNTNHSLGQFAHWEGPWQAGS